MGILTENLFSGRFRYVEELRRMGADIKTEGHHAVVRGSTRLSGAPVRAPDIRAGRGAGAGRAGGGRRDQVTGAHHIDRGYEDLVGDLRPLGATGDPPVNGGALRSRRALRPGRRRRPGGPGPPGLAGRARRCARPGGGPSGLPGAGALHDRADGRAPGRGSRPSPIGSSPSSVRAGPDPAPEAIDQVGVLAVDPTSPFSGGAILGDRVRMQQHALDPTVFIRSMATRGHLGGTGPGRARRRPGARCGAACRW